MILPKYRWAALLSSAELMNLKYEFYPGMKAFLMKKVSLKQRVILVSTPIVEESR
jgi:hypothetical protein